MLTRRGGAFVAVGIAGFALAWSFGARSLNAVVGPILVALLVGYIQLKRTSHPQLDVSVPSVGSREDEVTITLDFSAPDPFAGTVELELDDGLEYDDGPVKSSIGETTVEFDVRLAKRGEQSIGPVRIVGKDVFGLFKRTFTHQVRETILVFPRIRPVDGDATVRALQDAHVNAARREFEQLREYQTGDPLRDVHWKSSAKRPVGEMLVRQFEAQAESERIEIVAEANAGRVDTVADATASIASALLDGGVAVGVTTPEGRVAPDGATEQRTKILTLLAHMESGRVHDRERARADVLVRGPTDREHAEIQWGGDTMSFDEFASGGARTTAPHTARADGGETR
ncbi:DUF58 domain-containing protein [Haladaptatus sp. T7]|uniref:DUF58 domain-containing protein n=1 Tax=Haladaptatus sp. T7 TaxID=2029368 RepID=UPI0021A25422|nr:DUF58 domain-containing protein [Haladaptatus sp. T7]GKZ14191.1 hypothetical protein HAL_20720 [Haladaptatus sp. T7]